MSSVRPHHRLLAELKRRGVFRVAAAYGAAAFVVLQVADLLGEGLQLPPIFLTVVTVLVLAGFPVALVLSWLYERSSAGALERTPEAGSGEIEGIMAEPRARRWTPGVLALVGTVLLAVGVVLVGSRAGDATAPPSEGAPVEGTLAAVLPFTVQGSPEVAYLGEGMVSLLGTKLDGAGELRTVDASAVFQLLQRDGITPGDSRAGPAIAEAFGAELWVTGTLVEAGGRIQLTATLNGPAVDVDADRQVSVEGSEDAVFDMVDDLAVQLLSGLSGGAAARVRRIAGVTTESLSALKFFLEGEEQFRRGQFDASLRSFQEATREDSTFALAHYRLSVVAEWALADALSRDAAEKAVLWVDRLAPRDRRMLDATLIRHRGDNLGSAQAYRSILGTHPDEIEAWLNLAEVLFHANPLHGRSFTESAEALDRVLALDPRHSTSLIHMARVVAFERDLERLNDLTDRFIALDPDPGRTFEIAALRAFATGDPTRVEEVRARLPGADEQGIALGVWATSVYGGDLDAGEELARALGAPGRSAEARRLAGTMMVQFALARGRWSLARERLAELARLSPGTALEIEAVASLWPYAPVGPAELASLEARLEALDPASVETSDNPSVVFTAHDALHPLIRDYLLGHVRARLGRTEAAVRHADAVEAAELPRTTSTLALDLALSVRAAVLRSEGRAEEALGELEAAANHAWYGQIMPSPFFARSLEHFTRAELLYELGRQDEAEAWYGTIGQMSPFELPYKAPALLRLAAIAERRGETDAAERYRAEAEALWAEADPEVRATSSSNGG